MDDCKERVAFDLMRLIQSSHNFDANERVGKDNVLDLYNECLTAVSGKRNWKPAVCGTIQRS